MSLHAREHDDEPQPGLPEALPADERLLWQGTPAWRPLARHALRGQWLAVYFGALVVWRSGSLLADGAAPAQLATSLAWMLGLSAVALGLVALLAWLVERTTLYTLTDRRLVLRIGIVLTVTYNLPLRCIDALQLRRLPDGHGELALRLAPPNRIGVMHLWPHFRPWHIARPEPMLRALPAVDQVAELLSQALQASIKAPQPTAQTEAGTLPAGSLVTPARPEAAVTAPRPEQAPARHPGALPQAA